MDVVLDDVDDGDTTTFNFGLILDLNTLNRQKLLGYDTNEV